MAWNLNNKKNEYLLHKNQSKELIDIYGIEVEYYKIEHIGKNRTFSEYEYKQSNPNDIFKIMMYPENLETFDNVSDVFGKMGMQFLDSINLIVSTETFKQIYINDFKDYMRSVGDIIKTSRGKLFEVTGIEDEVPGFSNMFTEENEKNILMLKCRIYNYKPSDNVPDLIDPKEYDFSNLESVFNDQRQEQEKEVVNVVGVRDSVFGDLG